MDMVSAALRLSRLGLTDIGGFRAMSVDFQSRLSIICGPNGVGKTTLLDAIASIFISNYANKIVTRRAGANSGSIEYVISRDGNSENNRIAISHFGPDETPQSNYRGEIDARYLLYLKNNRDFSHQRLDGVLRDPVRHVHEYQQAALNGISTNDIKQWFSNRYLMAYHSDKWPPHQKPNLDLAKTFFSLLDQSVSLSHVDTTSFEIILETNSGKIPFEYMSSGFRSSYALLLGILKEIEFRQLNVAARDFSGLILIDEIDLHLHPTWHGPILLALESAYPRAQIVVTTHSPHIVQHANRESLIILPKEGTSPRVLPSVDSEYGLIGWTVEEILRDVMGMDDPRPPRFAELMQRYENAVSTQDEESIRKTRKLLERALHPTSVVRQIIAIEAI